MSDLTKGYGAAGSEVAGRPPESMAAEGSGWFAQDSDAAEVEARIAFKRGEEPALEGSLAAIADSKLIAVRFVDEAQTSGITLDVINATR